MKINWREISACNYCSNYNKKESYCNEKEKELTIYDELKGCERIIFTGGLKLELFKEIPRDSILRSLSIENLSKSNPLLKNGIASNIYGDYFSQSKTIGINSEINLAKSEKEGKVISFKKFKEAEEAFKRKKAEESFFSQSDHLLP